MPRSELAQAGVSAGDEYAGAPGEGAVALREASGTKISSHKLGVGIRVKIQNTGFAWNGSEGTVFGYSREHNKWQVDVDRDASGANPAALKPQFLKVD